MQCVQRSAVQFFAVRCSVVQCGAVRCSTVQCGAASVSTDSPPANKMKCSATDVARAHTQNYCGVRELKIVRDRCISPNSLALRIRSLEEFEIVNYCGVSEPNYLIFVLVMSLAHTHRITVE